MKDLLGFIQEIGATARNLTRKERWTHAQKWREAYCYNLHARTGKWTDGQYAWHVFSSGETRSLRGSRAEEEYRRLPFFEIFVIPESDRYPAVLVEEASAPINFSLLRLDLYISPAALEWTMVYTHGHPLYGPFFAWLEWARQPAEKAGRTHS